MRSEHGLITTVAYKFGDDAPVYALEGSIAVTGSAVQWLRDQLHLIKDAAASERLARSVDGSDGIYFVPAFSGLFAPYWRSDARGAIVGLARFHTDGHLARATLESMCYQSRDVVEAMEQDSGVHLDVLKVDGGVTANDLCMQTQADVLGVPVSRPVVAETTALGAAYAAGLAVGFWRDTDELREHWHESKRLGRRSGPRSSAPRATPAGRRPSSAPWTGWTSTDHLPHPFGRRRPASRPNGPTRDSPFPAPGTAVPQEPRRPDAARHHRRARGDGSPPETAATAGRGTAWSGGAERPHP